MYVIIVPKSSRAQIFTLECCNNRILEFHDSFVQLDRSEFYGAISEIRIDTISRYNKRYKICDSPLMYHLCANPFFDVEGDGDEYVTIYDTSINITNLIVDNVNLVSVEYKPQVSFDGHYFFFEFNNAVYLLCRVQERRWFRNGLTNHLLLFHLDNKKIANVYAFYDCPDNTVNCFGDFNDDKHLDFLDWRRMQTKIKLFSIKNEKFFLDPLHYIVVKPTLQQESIMKSYDDLIYFEEVDKKKTRWFYKCW